MVTYYITMYSKTSIVFSTVAIAAVVLLFGSGPILSHQALAVLYYMHHYGHYYGHYGHYHYGYGHYRYHYGYGHYRYHYGHGHYR
jgi:hypothetical protein